MKGKDKKGHFSADSPILAENALFVSLNRHNIKYIRAFLLYLQFIRKPTFEEICTTSFGTKNIMEFY